MAQLSDLLSRLVGAGGTRGLSGGAAAALPDEPALAWLSSALRRHAAGGDLVADPALLWEPAGMLARRGGLRAHLAGEAPGGVLGCTDLLVVVSAADWERGFRDPRAPFVSRATALLRERVADLLSAHDLHLPSPGRPLGVEVVVDGGPALRGGRFGLGPGEFVTGLLPQRYSGPVAGSRVALKVHLAVPAAWSGWREVAAVYGDQVLFTIGDHFLDSWSHPVLGHPSLYRLHQYADGSFVHVLNPEVRDAVRLGNAEVDGVPVLTLERAEGGVLCHVLLEVVDAPKAGSRPWNDTLDELSGDGAGPFSGARTVVPAELDSGLVELHERGALLQKVHFARFMEGYDVYVAADGSITTAADAPAITLHVRGRQVSAEAHVPGVRLDGRPLTAPVFLGGDALFELGPHRVAYRDLSPIRVDGWPYLGELARAGARVHLSAGAAHRIGREPRCAVRLPDEPWNDNIVWRPELRDGGTIRSRNGDIPKTQFYTDSIMVASEHAEVDLTGPPLLRTLARHCYTFVRRGGEIFSLPPAQDAGAGQAVPLAEGDEILIGNSLFVVRLDAAPRSRLRAEDLSSALDDAPLPPPPAPVVPPPRAAPLGPPAPALPAAPRPARGADLPTLAEPPVTLDDSGPAGADADALPAARGLGERGAPPPPPVFPVSTDSLIGLDAPERLPPPRAAAASPTVGPPMELAGDPTDLPDGPPPAIEIPRSADSIIGDREDPLSAPPGAPAPAFGAVGPVATVEATAARRELGAPLRLVLIGWMVSGTRTLGNHPGADFVVPEWKESPAEVFAPALALRVTVAAGAARVERLDTDAARLRLDGRLVAQAEAGSELHIELARRAPGGAERFPVPLRLAPDPSLPEPRAWLLAVDRRGLSTRALLCAGLHPGPRRALRLGPIAVSAQVDAAGALVLSGYADTYARPDGTWAPFFVSVAGGPWRTAPEDASPLRLAAGDRLLAGAALYAVLRGPDSPAN